MTSGRSHLVFYTLAGLILGFPILHPYAMLVQRLVSPHPPGPAGNGAYGWIYHFSDPMMLPNR